MSKKVVIFVGVLTEYQGVDLLLEAIPLVVKKIPQVRFVIVGYPNEQLYREKAGVLGVDQPTVLPDLSTVALSECTVVSRTLPPTRIRLTVREITTSSPKLKGRKTAIAYMQQNGWP